jgi:predicted RecB family nuclease
LCHAELVALDDPTLVRGITNDERAELAEAGITTIAAIAALDPDDERIADPQIVLDARVKTAGVLMRSDDPDGGVAVPTAAREVDFDIETYGGRIYLAGFLITENGSSHFDPVVDWDGTDESERAFVIEMFDRLASYGDDDTVVLHWSEYERGQLIAAADRHDVSIPGFEAVSDWFDRYAVDLYEWTRSTFASPTGFSLKAIAPMCGFHWRDDDPGGLQSEIWYEMMLAGDDHMRQRLLEYNEDDVAAQLAIRAWIKDQDSGRGPGSSIPSVHAWTPNG